MFVTYFILILWQRVFKGLSHKLVEIEKRSIEHDHPFVCAIGEFAVATFNKLREMVWWLFFYFRDFLHFSIDHFLTLQTHLSCQILKKGEQKKLHDYEIMECQYMKLFKVFYFYMTIEAFEEGILGVYEAKIVCNRVDGKRTLTKFVLTDRTPVGM